MVVGISISFSGCRPPDTEAELYRLWRDIPLLGTPETMAFAITELPEEYNDTVTSDRHRARTPQEL
jgi:hypothetical protein